MRIAILGTRGIPNAYGGFEQFAEYLSLGLVQRGFDVTVYNSHTHPYKESEWNNVKIVHCYDPEIHVSTVGQFIYDLNCILDCRKKDFDVILQLGYTSSSVWLRLLDKKKFVVTTNMDGFEWKRSKYSKSVQKFLRLAEQLAVKGSTHLIADSTAIQRYLKEKYQVNSTFIPYGAEAFYHPDERVLKEYHLTPYGYNVLIARLEPENSIEIILDGVCGSDATETMVVIGNCETKYGAYLKKKYLKKGNIQFLSGIYDINKLNNVRYFSRLYFHGHTVGGTNPSLLEAMASQALVCAHNNEFNAAILGDDAYYFNSASDVTQLCNSIIKGDELNRSMVSNNLKKIQTKYTWQTIVQQYIAHFQSATRSIRAAGENMDIKVMAKDPGNLLSR